MTTLFQAEQVQPLGHDQGHPVRNHLSSHNGRPCSVQHHRQWSNGRGLLNLIDHPWNGMNRFLPKEHDVVGYLFGYLLQWLLCCRAFLSRFDTTSGPSLSVLRRRFIWLRWRLQFGFSHTIIQHPVVQACRTFSSPSCLKRQISNAFNRSRVVDGLQFSIERRCGICSTLVIDISEVP